MPTIGFPSVPGVIARRPDPRDRGRPRARDSSLGKAVGKKERTGG